MRKGAKERSRERGKTIKDLQAEKRKMQKEKDKAQIDWHTSATSKNNEVKLFALTYRTDEISTLKGEVIVSVCLVWPEDVSFCGYNMDDFTDIIDEAKVTDPWFETLCSLAKALQKKSDWNICKVFVKKVKKKKEAANNNGNNEQ